MTEKVEGKIGKENLIIETGKMAKLADGAVTVQYGGTVVLVAVVCSKEPKEDTSFLPLTVEYQEKNYAAGKIPGGFFKREGRPSEKEILSSRLIDRPIRPLFPKGFVNEIQIMAIVLSADEENDPDYLALIGASAALAISDIPFPNLLGGVRVGRIGDKFVVNPTFSELQESSLNLVVAGTRNGVTMVEAGANELNEDIFLEAIEFGHNHISRIIELEEKLVETNGKSKREIEIKKIDETLVERINQLTEDKFDIIDQLGRKDGIDEAINMLFDELATQLLTENPAWTEEDIKEALEEVHKTKVRRQILDKGIRMGGRDYKSIRPISCEVGILPRTHGSALFTRGQTQSLVTATLGTRADEQMIDALEGVSYKRFMLHYSFPPFSVGEIRPVRGPGRREIGHGALAERALLPIMPTEEEFPYTVRIVSDILESNGSTSMATVCGGSLALMDAGIPIKAAVAGIAMGLVKEGEKTVILTDIIGLEDHFGDMDFKVTGTRKGITALQLDIKIDGVSRDILSEAMKSAKEARNIILDKMAAEIDAPKPSLSPYAPRIETLTINPKKIGDLIGPGGKTVRKIQDDTGVKIEIEDDGKVIISSTDANALEKALEIIKELTEEVEVGKVYLGRIKRISNFGAFCEILPGKEGLIHISELSDKFVSKVEDIIKLGDEVKVKVIEIDEQGRINLSKKQA